MTDRLTDFAIPARDRIPGVAWHHALLDDTVKRSDLLKTILSSGTINFSDHRITGVPLFTTTADAAARLNAAHISGHPGVSAWQGRVLRQLEIEYEADTNARVAAGQTVAAARVDAAADLAPQVRGHVEMFRAGTQPLVNGAGDFIDPLDPSRVVPLAEVRARGLYLPLYSNDPLLARFGFSGSGALDSYYAGVGTRQALPDGTVQVSMDWATDPRAQMGTQGISMNYDRAMREGLSGSDRTNAALSTLDVFKQVYHPDSVIMSQNITGMLGDDHRPIPGSALDELAEGTDHRASVGYARVAGGAGLLLLTLGVAAASAESASVAEQRPDDKFGQLEPWVSLVAPTYGLLAGMMTAAVLANRSLEEGNGNAGAVEAALGGFLLGLEHADQTFKLIYRTHTGGDLAPDNFRLLRSDQLRVEGEAIVAASRWEYTFTNGSPTDPLEYSQLSPGSGSVIPGYHFTVRDRQTGAEGNFYAGQVGDAFATPIIGLGIRSSSGAFFSASVTQQSLEQGGYIDTTSAQPTANGSKNVLQVRMINGENAGEVVEIRTRTESGITTTSVSERKAATARAEAEKARQAALIAEAERQHRARILGEDIQFGQSIGSAFGSAIGNAIGGDNVFARIGASTVLGATLGTIGAGFGRYGSAASGGVSLGDAVNDAFHTFSANLGQAFQSATVGAVSSFLVGELAEGLGFDGQTFGDQLLRSGAGGVIIAKWFPKASAGACPREGGGWEREDRCEDTPSAWALALDAANENAPATEFAHAG